MIEITDGTLDERILRLLQKKYPITVSIIQKKLHISKDQALRNLKKLQTKGILQLEYLPNKIYVRLLRHDFKYIRRQQQRKFIKHSSGGKKQETKEYNGMMYS